MTMVVPPAGVSSISMVAPMALEVRVEHHRRAGLCCCAHRLGVPESFVADRDSEHERPCSENGSTGTGDVPLFLDRRDLDLALAAADAPAVVDHLDAELHRGGERRRSDSDPDAVHLSDCLMGSGGHDLAATV
jgi:hypothetical protein